MDWLFSFQYATLFYKLIALVIFAIFIKVFLKISKNSLRHFVKNSRPRYRAQELLGLVSWGIFLIVFVILFSHEIKEFAIPFSVIGAGIAFSLQEVIASVAGRIAIVAGKLYQIGDRIQVGEMQGDVIAIGFLRTSLMEIGNWVKADQHTGRVIHVTNSAILKDNLINYSATFPFVWDEVVIPVRYGSNQHLARKIILEITNRVTQNFQIKANEMWSHIQDRYLIEQSHFISSVTLNANDNWLEFTARYIVPFNQRRLVKDQLCTQYVDAFAETSGKVAYGSMTIEITHFPQLKVNTE